MREAIEIIEGYAPDTYTRERLPQLKKVLDAATPDNDMHKTHTFIYGDRAGPRKTDICKVFVNKKTGNEEIWTEAKKAGKKTKTFEGKNMMFVEVL